MNGPIRPLDLSSGFIAVTSPFDGSELGIVADIPAGIANLLIEAAKKGAHTCRRIPRYERASILERCATRMLQDVTSLSDLIVAESGKTITQATNDVLECVDTLRLSASEVRRNAGEVIPFDAYDGSSDRRGWFTREPLGVIVVIASYCDPLALIARKLGPAIAGANAVIVKPSEYTPLSAIRLVNYLIEAGLPSEIVTVATGGSALVEALVSSRDVRMVSFSGGLNDAEKIAGAGGLKRFAMDFDGTRSAIVMSDCELDAAIRSCISTAYGTAGQSSVGIQHILVQATIYEEFKNRFVAKTKTLVSGDPASPETDVGPMISVDVAERMKSLVDVAISQGTKILCGNTRDGSVYAPTVLENVCDESELWQWEGLTRIAVLRCVHTLDEAITLAAGMHRSYQINIFTRDIESALDITESLQADAVIFNDSASYRCGAMRSGAGMLGKFGPERVRLAYEEMTQTKVVCIRG
ncbi:aldehyde dehydrogenase family protein [Paraburkholderia terrae]|uniref:Aldehyde dehydrogenase n=1 Tax=Paraburkholderia terrae TaxID=311230 RepID=A0A2I8F4N9_9BURK|nr:aldehyde dehydrogenase family protein [Paraburkholderia terrae]AUT66753.1 aldehyde dehydrogenase [Paraburkholderia terrae]